MEKLGQLRASDAVGPDHRRHPAVPVGAGLPRRPEPAGPLPRRPDDPAADGAGRPAPGMKFVSAGLPGLQPDHQQGARAVSCCATLRRSSPRWTRCSAASASAPTRDLRAAPPPGTAFLVVATPEPDALREASYFVDRLSRRGHAAGRPGAQPHPPAGDHRRCRPPAPRAPRRRSLEAGGAGPSWRRRRCGCTPSGWRWPPASSTWPTGSPARTPRSASGRCPPPPATCTTSTGCAPWARS